jgi:hypothetical protein
MENKIKLSNYVNPYVQYFQIAQLNLSKYMEEEAHIFKRVRKLKTRLPKNV